MSTAANARPAKTRRRAPFVAGIRGDLAAALASPEAFLAIAPSVPRSVAWLRDGTLARSDFTARDIALFETVLALTSAATGPETEETILAERLCPVDHALTVCSVGGSPVQPRELVAPLSRLFGRLPVPLKRGTSFSFHVPAWTVPIQQPGTRYAHIDLAVLARFRRRSSPLLYRDILAHVASEKIRYEPGAPAFTIAYAPEKLANLLGMPEPHHVGQLRLRYVDPAIAEIREHVRAFEITDVSAHHEARRRSGELVRGEDGQLVDARAVAVIVLTIRLCPPDRLETTAARAIGEENFAFLRERMDAAPFAIRPETLVRLGSTLPSTILTRKKRGGAQPLLSSEMQSRYLLWLAAIHEAVTGEAITPAFETAPLRGQRLIDAIERDGADRTFWAFSMAEAEAPDLAPALEGPSKARLRVAIEAARKARADAARKEAAKARRQAVRDARADGTMPAPVPKRESTDSHEKPVIKEAAPAPVPPPAPQPGPVGEDAIARAMAILATPEARKEAKALGWHWQFAVDFPFANTARMAKQFLKVDFKSRFPLLCEADVLLGRPYGNSIVLLAKIFGVTKENFNEDGVPEAPKYIDNSLAETATLVLGKGFAFMVEDKKLDVLVQDLASKRDWMRSLRKETYEKWRAQEAAKAKAAAQALAARPSFRERYDTAASLHGYPRSIVPTRKNSDGVYEAVEE